MKSDKYKNGSVCGVYVSQVLSYHASAGEEETRALEVTAVI